MPRERVASKVTPYLSGSISVRRRGSKVFTFCLAGLYFAIIGSKLLASMILLTNYNTPFIKTVFRNSKARVNKFKKDFQ
jgi:hypothetical protein